MEFRDKDSLEILINLSQKYLETIIKRKKILKNY